MQAILVGADRLGNIPIALTARGISILRHLSGREPAAQRTNRCLPAGADMLILFTDFLGHNVMRGYRDAGRRAGVPVVACRRSVTALNVALDETLQAAARG